MQNILGKPCCNAQQWSLYNAKTQPTTTSELRSIGIRQRTTVEMHTKNQSAGTARGMKFITDHTERIDIGNGCDPTIAAGVHRCRPTDGTNGQVLTTNGGGVVSWLTHLVAEEVVWLPVQYANSFNNQVR